MDSHNLSILKLIHIINLLQVYGVVFLGAKNKIVAGDYEGSKVSSMFGVVSISTGFASTLELNKKNSS
jgi:hypothetical protein